MPPNQRQGAYFERRLSRRRLIVALVVVAAAPQPGVEDPAFQRWRIWVLPGRSMRVSIAG